MKNFALRILAVFVLEALGTIGAGAILGVQPLLGAALSGILAVTVVFQDLARSFIPDGVVTEEEKNAAFKKAVKDDE